MLIILRKKHFGQGLFIDSKNCPLALASQEALNDTSLRARVDMIFGNTGVYSLGGIYNRPLFDADTLAANLLTDLEAEVRTITVEKQ